MTAPSAPDASDDRLDTWLIATVALLSALTVVLILAPTPLRVVAPVLDLTLDNIAMLISALVAVLAWVRYRERHEEFALFQASAFLIPGRVNPDRSPYHADVYLRLETDDQRARR